MYVNVVDQCRHQKLKAHAEEGDTKLNNQELREQTRSYKDKDKSCGNKQGATKTKTRVAGTKLTLREQG